jgi:hypothetical protein
MQRAKHEERGIKTAPTGPINFGSTFCGSTLLCSFLGFFPKRLDASVDGLYRLLKVSFARLQTFVQVSPLLVSQPVELEST